MPLTVLTVAAYSRIIVDQNSVTVVGRPAHGGQVPRQRSVWTAVNVVLPTAVAAVTTAMLIHRAQGQPASLRTLIIELLIVGAVSGKINLRCLQKQARGWTSLDDCADLTRPDWRAAFDKAACSPRQPGGVLFLACYAMNAMWAGVLIGLLAYGIWSSSSALGGH